MNYSYYLENMNILWTKICFDLLEIATKFLTCLKLSYMLKHKTESKMIHSESDFSFAINSVSDFDSASESSSESESESDFSSVFMNLDICIFSILYLHYTK